MPAHGCASSGEKLMADGVLLDTGFLSIEASVERAVQIVERAVARHRL